VIDLAKNEGVSPRAYQDVAWAGAKKLRDGKNYSGSRPMIEEVNQAIERTARVTGMSPEEVLKQGIIRSKIPIYGAGGVMVAPSLIESINELREANDAPAPN